MVHPGPGNIQADPLFRSPISQDFRLQPTSPCVDEASSPDIALNWPNFLMLGTGVPTPIDILASTRDVDYPGVGGVNGVSSSSMPPGVIVDMGAFALPAP